MSATAPVLRRLGPGDLAAFLALRVRGFETDADTFRYTAADDAAVGEARWAERVMNEFVIAAEHEGALVARGGLAPAIGEKLAHKGLIWGMYVAHEHRGAGLADRIMRALLDEAAVRFRHVTLTLLAANSRARRFYERHGFTLYAIEPEAIRMGDAYADEASMWRRV